MVFMVFAGRKGHDAVMPERLGLLSGVLVHGSLRLRDSMTGRKAWLLHSSFAASARLLSGSKSSSAKSLSRRLPPIPLPM